VVGEEEGGLVDGKEVGELIGKEGGSEGDSDWYIRRYTDR
jgi:hypothetical protein